MKHRIALFGLSVACLSPFSAQAVCDDHNYGFQLTVTPVSGGVTTATDCTKTAQQFIDSLDSSKLQALISTYTPISVSTIDANFNSLNLQLAFPTAGPALTFTIPALGVNETFTGTTRDDSVDLLEDYLKKSGVAGQIMKYQASNSPNSPIAGVNGAIPQAVAQDFGLGLTAPYQYSGGESEGVNLVGGGAEVGTSTSGGKKSSVYSIPASYVWRSKETPGLLVSFGGSLSAVETEGAKAYHAGIGLGMRIPITANWALLPALRYAVTEAVDLNSVAGVYSASLGSTYRIPMGDLDLTIGNMAGYYRTSKLSVGGYSFDPDVKTLAARNGLMLSQPVEISGIPLSLEYYVVDTRYMTGTKFFVNNTQELGVTLGTNRRGDVSKGYFRLGLRYLRGKQTNGFSLQGSYWF